MSILKRFLRAAARLAQKQSRAASRATNRTASTVQRRGTGRRGPAAVLVDLTRAERRTLEAVVRRERTPQALAMRVRVVLALATEPSSCVLAVAEQWANGDRKYVRKWRERYRKDGLEGLKTRPRPGRPTRIGPVSRCQVLAMACGKPADFDVPHRTEWTLESLSQAYTAKEQAVPGLDPMSRTSILRVLNRADVRPHRIKMWLHSPDPRFREKVTELCELYLHPPPGTHVLCVDEKTGMQALGRKHPSRTPAPGRDARMDYEYVRNGTRKLIACWDTQTGEIYGEVRASRKAVDLVEFMEAVALKYPKGDVHIIWDNLNIHYDGKTNRWTEFNRRHGGRFHFHYTPIHASWVNQVELWFGIFHRRVLRRGVFNSLDEIDVAVAGFIDHWNAHERKPFKWAFKGYPMQTGLKDAA